MMGKVVNNPISKQNEDNQFNGNATNGRNNLVLTELYPDTIQIGESRQTKKMVMLKQLLNLEAHYIIGGFLF